MPSFNPIGQFPPRQDIGVQGLQGAEETKESDRVYSEQVQQTQQKLKFALVDSGMGGGMTAAFLKGEVRQLGSYFCLPIGDKKPAQAEAYTAAMALWPLIMPLANGEGQYDGRVAENVIIACNSASVRKEGAVELMAEFCDKALRSDFRDLPQNVKSGMRSLFAAVNQERHGVTKDHFKAYFTEHVHEIVSKTAERGAQDAVGLLQAHDKSNDPLLVRVDSTNGTAGSESYPTKIIDSLKSRIGGCGGARLLGSTKTNTEGSPSYVITHHVVEVTVDNEPRTLVIEGRGNPPWVAAIESGASEEARSSLVQDSNAKSNLALARSIENIDDESAKGILTALREKDNRPGLSMLCCTHYPAMTKALAENNGNTETHFINQATIVQEIADQPDDGEPNPLRLALTVGSMNYGGAPGDIRPSLADPDKTAETLGKVLEETMSSGSNIASLGSVKVFSQGRPLGPTETIESYDSKSELQQSFEIIHKMMVTSDDAITRLYAEQNLARNPEYWPGSNEPPFTFVANETRTEQVKPKEDKLSGSAKEIRANFSSIPIGTRLNKLGVLMTLGESRGIDRIAPLNDQGLQLQTATAHLMDIVAKNKNEDAKKEHVGILTGFTVVNNADRSRVQGENDGPPGAVMMGKTLVSKGTPVVFVTDHSAEASLLSSLLGAGLAELKEGSPKEFSNLRLEHVKLEDGVSVKIPEILIPDALPEALRTDDIAAREGEIETRHARNREAVQQTVANLRDMNVTTMISIERPSVTQLDGGIYSMLGIDVAPFNPDLSPALGTEGFQPFTIGIGDGGNELGTGGIQFMTSEARDEQLLPFAKGGSVIGAKAELATDVMLLSTVSNNGGVAISMALHAAANQEALPLQLDGVIDSYNGIIQYLKENNMSFDGVNKKNLLTVDGRRLGTRKDAENRWDENGWNVPLGVGPTGKEGAESDTTHNDTFLKFKHTLLGIES